MRKKNLSLAMLAACAGLLLAGASCKKGGDGSVAPATGAAFTATAETHTGDGKTHLYADEENAVKWDANDEIVVYNKVGDSYTFAATTVDPSSTTGFGNDEVPAAFYLDGPQYNAFYPKGATYDKDAKKWTWTLPENQTYEEDGFAKDANPMAARSESKTLSFKNVCGLLQLKLYGQGVKVRSITVTSNTDNLSGAGTVSWGKDGDGEEDVPVFEVNGGVDSKSVTLTCPDVELSAEESNPTSFYIVLPAHALESGWFTVKVKDYRDKSLIEKGAECSEALTGIQRSKIRPMPAFDCRVPATGVSLDKSRMGFVIGGTTSGTLTATLTPDNSTDVVTWSSDNQTVATVDDNGNVTAGAKGQATITATTTSGKIAECLVTVAPKGAIPGLFSVSEDEQVFFSKGNLRAKYNSSKNYTWSFAENQYDVIGNAAGNTTITGNGTNAEAGQVVDLFGWSTIATYYGIYTDNINSAYSGDFEDWGTNSISNAANAWRTLSGNTGGEWEYLLDSRRNIDDSDGTKTARFAKAVVHGRNGLLVFPDWIAASGNAATINGVVVTDVNNKGASLQAIADAVWPSLEGAGVVFLPCAGFRNGTSVNTVGSDGYYWSSLPNGTYNACYLYFNSGNLNPATISNRYIGRSVRLVCP